MSPMKRIGIERRGPIFAGLLAATVFLAGCTDKAADKPVAPPPPPPAAAAPSPAAAPAPVVAPTPIPTPKTIPLSVQGVSPAGLTVRVKGIEIGADATVLDVSVSFANRIDGSTMLAMADTFLEDEGKGRLQIKRPDDNRNLALRQGQTMEGQLVFMGAVSPQTKKLRLVFNEGYQEDNIIAPGLSMDLPLQ